MKCPSCGNENRSGSKFCRFCGQVLSSDENTELESGLADSHSDITVVPPPPEHRNDDDPYDTLIVDPSELFDPPIAPSASSIPVPEETTIPEVPTNLENLETPPTVEISGSDLPPSEVLPPEPGNTDTVTERVFSFLQQGTILADRYRISALLAEEPEAVLYQAEDLRLCWSCGAEQSNLDMRFCDMCGIELTSYPLVTLRQTHHLPLEAPNIYQTENFTYQVEPGPEVSPPTPPQPVAGYFAGYASDTGRLRDIDEDSVVILQLAGLCNRCSGPTLGFFAVADGIGGQDAGEVASRTAIHALAESIMQNIFIPFITKDTTLPAVDLSEEMIAEKLTQAISRANQAIIDLRAGSATGSNMGSTLTTALLIDKSCVVANVGDSRTYRLHAGKLTQITRDHSIVANMVASGEISTEQALVHERKGVIYRCLGDLEELEIDTFMVDLEIGDRLMLCCDGLWEMVPDGLIEDILLQYTDPQAACQRLVTLANEAGGDDNISVIIINIQSVT